MTTTNWAIINAKAQKRWELANEQQRYKILEERVISKKAKFILEFTKFDIHSGEFSLELNGITLSDKSKVKLIEKALRCHYGILVKLTRYPVIRFDKLPECPPILDLEDQKVHQKVDKRLELLTRATKAIQELDVETAKELQALLDKVTQKKVRDMGPSHLPTP